MSAPPIQALLFVCNMNAIRSPMAQGLMRRRFAGHYWVQSCGIRPAREVDALAVEVMDELGVDIARHRPQSFDDLDDSSFDLIITLAPEAHHRALEFTRTLAIEVEYWPCLDPTVIEGSREQILAEYRAVRDGLDRRIASRFERPLSA